MKIQYGPPPCDGRFIIFVPRENSDYAEPIVGDCLHGKWLWRQNVLGWIGPLPEPQTIVSMQLFRQEYDL